MSTLYSSLWRDTSEEEDDEDDQEGDEEEGGGGGGVSNDSVIRLLGYDLKVRTLYTVFLCYCG